MAISQTKYVDIKSGVGGQSAAANKELILRVFTKNPLTVAGTVAEYDNAAAVGTFYGTQSEEYKIAAAYFAYQSRRNTSPKKISFWLDDRTAESGESGSAEEKTITDVLNESFNASNNFGSFKFLDESIISDMALAAEWNSLKNNQAMFLLSCTAVNYESLQAALSDFNGVGLIYQTLSTDLDWVLPAAVLASVDYTKINAAPNFMYKQLAGLTPSVTTDALYNTLTALNINFYGATQQSGKEIAFFQNGTLQGSVTDMGVYANEIWLKDAMATIFLNHQLSVEKWPANLQGEAIGEALANNVIEQAIYNGTLSVGKTLNNAQKIYVANLTGNTDAWRTLQDKGFIFDGKMVNTLNNGTETWKYEYSLIYCKGDSVRKVEGYHTLI